MGVLSGPNGVFTLSIDWQCCFTDDVSTDYSHKNNFFSKLMFLISLMIAAVSLTLACTHADMQHDSPFTILSQLDFPSDSASSYFIGIFLIEGHSTLRYLTETHSRPFSDFKSATGLCARTGGSFTAACVCSNNVKLLCISSVSLRKPILVRVFVRQKLTLTQCRTAAGREWRQGRKWFWWAGRRRRKIARAYVHMWRIYVKWQ